MTRVAISDLIIIAAVVIFCTAAIIRPFSEPAAYVVVHTGSIAESFPLSQDRTVRAGNTTIMIKSGRAAFTESSCRHKVCRSSGWISRPGESAACVPNRVMIEIAGDAAGYDAVAR